MNSKKPIDRSTEYKKLLDLLKSKDNFILTTHKSCDPDGIGSELGLSFLLSHLKKNHTILNPDKMPDRYEFIDKMAKVSHVSNETFQSSTENKTVIIVDNSDLPRIGDVNRMVKDDKSNLIIIDHHDNVEPFPGLYFFPEIGSTSEIIYELLELEGLVPDYNTSVALYLGIIMDTGQFKYSKTRPRTHQIAAKLLEQNFSPEELIRKLYEDYPTNVLLLKSDIYSAIEIHSRENVISVDITRAMLGKYNYTSNPLDGIASEFLGPKNIHISITFTEGDEGKVKISFRSKGKYDVCAVAKKFGGGGHKNASGAMIIGDFKTIKEQVLQETFAMMKFFG